jgi:hypothetical protein
MRAGLELEDELLTRWSFTVRSSTTRSTDYPVFCLRAAEAVAANQAEAMEALGS